MRLLLQPNYTAGPLHGNVPEDGCKFHNGSHVCNLRDSLLPLGILHTGWANHSCTTYPARIKEAVTAEAVVAPIIIVAHARPVYLQRTLLSLFR
jgi:hypothetical protein